MAIFLDASYLIALYNESDMHHQNAASIAQRVNSNEFGHPITSDHVFDEAVSVTLRKFGKEKAQLLGKQILDSIFMVQCDRHLFDAAFRIFNSSEEPFSFTDCASQAIIGLVQIKFIATFDKLFEKLDVEIVS
ncbi:type II toxin-antitoxin system VapC family toxin [Candidatus Woesearchaeota archaeon]|nr:type II toxin-antitoxin system VapC family toxin [Candidatus Woesearchaeota archaeon]